jgi:hypothetical protein
MAKTTLILHPTNPGAGLVDQAEFIDCLCQIGLLGEQCAHRGDSHCYRQGKRFFELVDFGRTHRTRILGDVNGQLQQVNEVDGRTLCHIEIHDNGGEPAILGICNAYTVPPLCPSCGYEIEKWDTVLGEWCDNKSGFVWHCPQCHAESTIHELDWRQGLAFARYAIEISEVWRGEAVPSKELLSTLSDVSGENWTYFYFRF